MPNGTTRNSTRSILQIEIPTLRSSALACLNVIVTFSNRSSLTVNQSYIIHQSKQQLFCICLSLIKDIHLHSSRAPDPLILNAHHIPLWTFDEPRWPTPGLRLPHIYIAKIYRVKI